MTYIRINITINEVKIREEIFKFYDRIESYIKHHYREAFIQASNIGTRHGAAPFVAGVHKLLNHKHRDFSGTILCECKRPRCIGRTLSAMTYAKKMRIDQ